jgi:hypothetical protein
MSKFSRFCWLYYLLVAFNQMQKICSFVLHEKSNNFSLN